MIEAHARVVDQDIEAPKSTVDEIINFPVGTRISYIQVNRFCFESLLAYPLCRRLSFGQVAHSEQEDDTVRTQILSGL